LKINSDRIYSIIALANKALDNIMEISKRNFPLNSEASLKLPRSYFPIDLYSSHDPETLGDLL